MWQLAPSEFWAMTLREWWAVFDVRRADRERVSKRLTKRQADDLLAWCAEEDRKDELKGIALHGLNR